MFNNWAAHKKAKAQLKQANIYIKNQQMLSDQNIKEMNNEYSETRMIERQTV